LHDIGKIGIQDKVLQKAGPLTNDEYSHIKQHPVIGAFILRSNQNMEDIVKVVLHHHERFDGKGYPHRLQGEAIPWWARMAAVADTYDALTSDRPYRQRMEQEKAVMIIDDLKDTQLCPEAVDLFLEWLGKQRTEAMDENDILIKTARAGT
jgi:HD-GYP domain-containing protein (c-di-GMP phosphodiesterase class II)